jgi:hypothetical protein
VFVRDAQAHGHWVVESAAGRASECERKMDGKGRREIKRDRERGSGPAGVVVALPRQIAEHCLSGEQVSA